MSYRVIKDGSKFKAFSLSANSYCDVKRGEEAYQVLPFTDQEMEDSRNMVVRIPAVPDGRRLSSSVVHSAGERRPDGNRDIWWKIESSYLANVKTDDDSDYQNGFFTSFDNYGVSGDSSYGDDYGSEEGGVVAEDDGTTDRGAVIKGADYDDLVSEYETKIVNYQAEVDKANSEAQSWRERASELEKSLDGRIDEIKQSAYDEGFQAGVAQASENAQREYDAQKEEYEGALLAQIEEVKATVASIQKSLETIDETLPKVVFEFVNQIVGAERKVNDKIIKNVISQNIDRIHELGSVTFLINNVDEDVFKQNFPNEKYELDQSIRKGGFKLRAKVGEVDFSLDTIVNNLKLQIYEAIE